MRACTYCRKILSAADSVCPQDQNPTVEIQPEALPAELTGRFAGFQPFACGGTGTLFLGLHAESGQMALLKLLSASLSREATDRARHHRELRKQIGIVFPHLPRVLEVGESAGRIWFLREFVSGDSLLVRLRLHGGGGGAMSTPVALGVIAQLATSLDALHRHALVQRDLKPGHVLFRMDNTGAEIVQLIDAGIAAPLPGRGPEARGTAAYTAPEIVEGGQATFRSDLYALGCVACELLTGKQPFARASVEETLAAQRTAPVPELDAAVPAAVRTLIASLLSKDPRRRPFSAQQVRRSLEPFLPDTVPPAPALPRSSPPPPPPEALGHGAEATKRSSPPLGALGPAASSGERPLIGAPPLGAAGPAANGGAPVTRSAPPLGGAGLAGDGSARKRSTPPPPPPEALGVSLDKARRGVPPAPAGALGSAADKDRPSAPPAAAANGGATLPPSKRPPAPDATMELRAEELEPASTYVALAKGAGVSETPASRSGAPSRAPEPAAVGTQELDLDALLNMPGDTAEAAGAALKGPSRVPTQRLGSLPPPAASSANPYDEDSAPTIAMDVSAAGGGAARVDELAQAVSSSAPPAGAGVSGQVAGSKPTSTPPTAAGPSSLPPAAAAVRSRKSTQMGMGPVREPIAVEPQAAAPRKMPARNSEHRELTPAGPTPVRIPSTFASAAAAADSAAITKAVGAQAPAARSTLEPVRAAEATLAPVDRMEPNAEQERTLRAARKPALGEHPSILFWAAAAMALLAIGLRVTRGRGPERAMSASVVVRVPEAEPVAQAPQPTAADEPAAQPTAAQADDAQPQLAAARPSEQPPSEPPAQPPSTAVAEPGVLAATEPSADQHAREEAPTGGNAALPAIPTVSAAQAGKGFLRDPGSVGAGGVVPYRARQKAESDFKASARQLYQEGKFREAAEAYQKASARAPSDPAAFAGLGASWLALGDSDRAIAAYQRAVQLKPEVSGFQAALGRAYLAKGDRARALAAYNKALELDPDNQAARMGAAALRAK